MTLLAQQNSSEREDQTMIKRFKLVGEEVEIH
jgi:hypothetical protein